MSTTHKTQEGVEFLVDDEDQEIVSYYFWWLDRKGYPYTVIPHCWNESKGRFVKRITRVHQFILGKAPEGLEWDHVDRNRLNNQKHNLRTVTHGVNQRNHNLRKDSTTGHRGINYKYGKYLVRIVNNRQEIIIGRYLKLEDAIEARKAAELTYWGETNNLQSPQELACRTRRVVLPCNLHGGDTRSHDKQPLKGDGSMATLQFNKVHRNGWYGFRIPGISGALFIDGRMLTAEGKEATPPATIEVDFPYFVAPGADASAKAAEKAEKAAAREALKAEKATKAIEKANARLAKLTETAAKAQAIVDAARAKVQ